MTNLPAGDKSMTNYKLPGNMLIFKTIAWLIG